MLISEKWIDSAIADELEELRELVHLSVDPRFEDFFKLPFGSISSDRSAVVGRAGHLFINEGSNRWRDQLGGLISIDDEVLQKTVDKVEGYIERCKALGVRFHICVFPEKDIICPDLSPNVGTSFCKHRSVHKIAERIKTRVSYPSEDMVEDPRVRTFHRRNSHTSFFGGMICANAVLRDLERPSIDDAILQTEFMIWPDDLSLKWVNGLDTRRRIIRQVYNLEERIKSERHTGKYLVYRNPLSRTDETIAIFGDSFAWNPDAGLAPFMSFEFRTVHFKWQKEVDWELVEQVKPSVLMVESAERFLVEGIR